jgi:hypothetical protein
VRERNVLFWDCFVDVQCHSLACDLCSFFRILMQAVTGFLSNVVDMYSVATGLWTTAQLSVARYDLAAASVGNIAIFAGGRTSGSTVLLNCVIFFACLLACWFFV